MPARSKLEVLGEMSALASSLQADIEVSRCILTETMLRSCKRLTLLIEELELILGGAF